LILPNSITWYSWESQSMITPVSYVLIAAVFALLTSSALSSAFSPRFIPREQICTRLRAEVRSRTTATDSHPRSEVKQLLMRTRLDMTSNSQITRMSFAQMLPRKIANFRLHTLFSSQKITKIMSFVSQRYQTRAQTRTPPALFC
jgi:hypothetical protein